MQDKKSILLIYSSQNSRWKSCNKIRENILKSYSLINNSKFSIEHIEINSANITENVSKILLRMSKIDVLVFVDHLPSPALIIKKLSETLDSLPQIVVHLYGNFVIHSHTWLDLGSILEKNNFSFICASEAQKNLISKFFSILTPGKDHQICPFPIDTSFFHPKHKESPSNRIFLYSGRLSYQKNIISLINCFNLYRTMIDSTAELWLCGPIDDIGHPYFNRHQIPGTYFSEIFKCIHSLPLATQESIKYFGDLNDKELIKKIHLADIFISLSTHHDEDYGMSAAEALSTGTPVILTNWGGYYSFDTYSSAVSLVELNAQFAFSTQMVIKEMFRCSSKKWNQEIISREAFEHFSLPTVSQKLESILSDNGYLLKVNENLVKTSERTRNGKSPFNLPQKNEPNRFYYDIYDDFRGKNFAKR